MPVGIIVAMDPSHLIGLNGDLPWRYPADLKRFKRLTMGGTVIMGRKTWESLPKPLPGRRCLVLSQESAHSSKHPPGSCEWFTNLQEALAVAPFGWVIGGASIYREVLLTHLNDVAFVDVTLVPPVELLDDKAKATATYFPFEILEEAFQVTSKTTNEEDPRLSHSRFERKDAH